MENNNEKFFILKRMLMVIPLELIIFSSVISLFIAILSGINDMINLPIEIFYVIFAVSAITGIITTFLSIKLLFRDKIEIKARKKIVIAMLIVQVIIFIFLLISGYNLLDDIVQTMRNEVSVERLLLGDYYDDVLDESIKLWKKYCSITISLYTIGSFIGIALANVRMKKWLIVNNSQNVVYSEDV